MRLPIWLHTMLNPECYHGHGQPPTFFEGWYYKLVDAMDEYRIALILGDFCGRDADKRHAFIQVLDGMQGAAYYCRFPESDFIVEPRALDAHVGRNRFTDEHLTLDIQAPDCQRTGEVAFG